MSLIKRFLLAFAWLLAGAFAVQAEDVTSTDGIEFFEKQVRPLLVERCYSCHSAQSGKNEGGLQLDSRAGWSTGGDRGAAAVPGDVENSLLIRAVRYTDPELQMPPDKPPLGRGNSLPATSHLQSVRGQQRFIVLSQLALQNLERIKMPHSKANAQARDATQQRSYERLSATPSPAAIDRRRCSCLNRFDAKPRNECLSNYGS